MENIFREIREATGLNQVDFGREIGRTHGSIQGYEAGKTPPREVVEKYKAIADQHGRGDLAALLSSGEWKVPRVAQAGGAQPGETSVGQGREKKRKVSADPLREHWHTILDEILDSGQAVAVNAVEYVLVVIEERVHLKARKPGKGK